MPSSGTLTQNHPMRQLAFQGPLERGLAADLKTPRSVAVPDSTLWARPNLTMHKFRIKLPSQLKRL